jgi:hypothetical protein
LARCASRQQLLHNPCSAAAAAQLHPRQIWQRHAAAALGAAGVSAAAAWAAAGAVARCGEAPYNPAEPPTTATGGAAGVLSAKVDPYGGVNIDADALPADPEAFAAALAASLEVWVAEGRRGVWLKIPLDRAALVAPAVAAGFAYHHAEKDYAMLTRWLPTDEPDPLPANASTQVGVGAVVVNEEGRVLLVQEAVGPTAGRDIWKIPTGLLDAREDIAAGVVRECREETGVEAVFEKVVAIRHAHTVPPPPGRACSASCENPAVQNVS